MRNARAASAFAVGLVLLVTACGGTATSSDGPTRPSMRRDVIRNAELSELTVTNAYDAILRLRPSWFRTRGQTTPTGSSPIRVYVDGISGGDLERLRSFSLDRVREMRRISASDATTRWGTGHQQGAIELITRG